MGSLPGSLNSPLRVIVVGAGIGGLTAALGLRRQGHQVQILERSSLSKEYGAALSVGVNASAVLRRLGVFLENYGGVVFTGFRIFKDDELLRSEARDWQSKYKQPYHMILRQDLHRALRDQATTAEGRGTPVVITRSCKVIDVDTKTATVTVEDGRTFEGDLVIAADGIHSRLRNRIPGAENLKEHPRGNGTYRCLIPREKLLADPITRPFVEHEGHFIIWMHMDPPTQVIMYPCEGGKTINISAGSNLRNFTEEELAAQGNITVEEVKQHLNEEYAEHSESIKGLISKIDSVGIWSYNDMDKIPSIVEDRLAIIGDAAHPFLPFLGQGGAMALEDGASIAALLPLGTSPADVSGRLKLYEKARYDRAHTVQEKTRILGSGRDGFREHPIVGKGGEFGEWLYNHDSWAESEKLLQ